MPERHALRVGQRCIGYEQERRVIGALPMVALHAVGNQAACGLFHRGGEGEPCFRADYRQVLVQVHAQDVLLPGLIPRLAVTRRSKQPQRKQG